MSHPLYSPEIRGLILDNDAEGLRAFADTLHPATIAEALDDEFTPQEIWQVLTPSDIRTQAAIFEYLPEWRQEEMVSDKAGPQVGQLIGKMSHDDRVDLLNRVPDAVKESLLRVVDEADRKDIATLDNYDEDSVGALMTTDYAWLPATLTAAEAVDQLRQQAPDRETIYYIYILADAPRKVAGRAAPRRLIGVLSLRALILAPRHAIVRDIMEGSGLVTLKASEDRQVAAELLARYDFIALPVIDDEGAMVGIVTHDDVIDVIQEEATEALQQQGGVSPLGEGYLETPFWSVWWARVRVLAVVFVLGWGTAYAIGYFEATLEAVTVLTLFIPLCTATGGNSGTQAATLVTRALALGELSLGDWLQVLRHEFLMGLAMGVVLAALGFLRAYLVPGEKLVSGTGTMSHLQLGLVLAQAVIAVCLVGTLVGAMLPLIFRRVGADPALASSPAVTTLVDVVGIVTYFSIASWWLL